MEDIEDIILAPSSKKRKKTLPFASVGILPGKEDNAAIATTIIEPGTKIIFEKGSNFEMDYKVLEGHRFCVRKIQKNSQITSWGMPFAVAVRDLSPGEYLCNGA